MERLIKAKVEPGRVAIHWLGQGGFALKAHAGDIIVIDPYLSDSANADGDASRLVEIPIKPKNVKLDYLFLTHDHLDHTDPHSAPVIAQVNPNAVIVCPPSSAHHLTKLGVPCAQMMAAMPGQSMAFPNFTAHVVSAHHTDDSVGYVFEFNEDEQGQGGPVVYLTGDTEYSNGLSVAVADFGPDVLLVPINGKGGNMDAAHAAKLTAEIAPREVIPMHWGMFAENTVDPADFLSLLATETNASTDINPVVMKHNACHIFCPEASAQGKPGRTKARADRARIARHSHQHHDGLRGPNGGSGILRGGGRSR